MPAGGGGPRIACMNTKKLLIVAIVCAACLGGCGRNLGLLVKPVRLGQPLTETVVAADGGLFVTDKIVIIDVDGMLLNRRNPGMFGGENPVSLFVEKIDRVEIDPRVKAVVLRINSPGGGVTASDIMYHRLMRLRAKRKIPVVAVLEDVAASGGYYVACGADTIVAHPTTVTGSIGVLVQTISFAGTMKLLGIEARAVVSGEHKDMASPLSPLEDEDIAILQGIVDEFYGRFLDVVASARPKLTREQVEALADGRVFTGMAALENGLVDKLAYTDDAVVLAKALSGARKVKVVIYHRPVGYRANVYSAAPGPPTAPQVNLDNITAPNILSAAQPQFLYLWTGPSR